ncbi:MAG: hypothetical protein ABIE94_02370 [archaeon]
MPSDGSLDGSGKTDSKDEDERLEAPSGVPNLEGVVLGITEPPVTGETAPEDEPTNGEFNGEEYAFTLCYASREHREVASVVCVDLYECFDLVDLLDETSESSDFECLEDCATGGTGEFVRQACYKGAQYVNDLVGSGIDLSIEGGRLQVRGKGNGNMRKVYNDGDVLYEIEEELPKEQLAAVAGCVAMFRAAQQAGIKLGPDDLEHIGDRITRVLRGVRDGDSDMINYENLLLTKTLFVDELSRIPVVEDLDSDVPITIQ